MQRDDDAASPPPNIASIDELLALAELLETEAIRLYGDLSNSMRTIGRDELAAVFADLCAEETRHRDAVAAKRRPSVDTDEAPPKESWPVAEERQRQAKRFAEIGGPQIVSEHAALDFAVQNEQRAFSLFADIAAAATDEAIRRQAEILAHEELRHLVRLRYLRRQAWRKEHGKGDLDPDLVLPKAAVIKTTAAFEGWYHPWAEGRSLALRDLAQWAAESGDGDLASALVSAAAELAKGHSPPHVPAPSPKDMGERRQAIRKELRTVDDGLLLCIELCQAPDPHLAALAEVRASDLTRLLLRLRDIPF